MKRNLNKMIEEGQKMLPENSRIDMKTSEMHQLLDKAMETRDIHDIYEAFMNAYHMGISVGSRIEKKRISASSTI